MKTDRKEEKTSAEESEKSKPEDRKETSPSSEKSGKTDKETKKPKKTDQQLTEESVEKAEKAFQAGDQITALKYFTSALKTDPSRADIYARRATCWYVIQKIADGTSASQETLAYKKTFLDNILLKTQITREKAQQALEMEKKQDEPFQKALSDCLRGHELSAENSMCRILAGVIYAQTGKNVEAVEFLSTLVTQVPEIGDEECLIDAGVHYILAQTAEKINAYFWAQQAYTELLVQFPTENELLKGRMINAFYAYDAVTAYQDVKKLLEKDPNNPELLRYLALSAGSTGATGEAFSTLEQLMKSAPQDASLWAEQGRVYYKNPVLPKAYDNAMSNFNRALEMNPTCYEALLYRGICYRDVFNDNVKAIQDLSQAVEQHQEDPRARLELGITYARTKNYPQALSNFTQTLKMAPQSQRTWYQRGLVLMEQGQYALAVSDFTRALEIRPEFYEAMQRRAESYLKMEKYNESGTDYTYLIYHDISDKKRLSEYYLGRAEVFEKLNLKKKARDDRSEASKIRTDF